MGYHITAFIAGFLLDMLLGDPYWLPHPIRAIGNLISRLEGYFLGKKSEEFGNRKRDSEKEVRQGRVFVVVVLLVTVSVASAILLFTYKWNLYLGVCVESVMTYQVLAAKCLKVESMKVYDCLKNQDLEAARKAVSMIVGRDTQVLDAPGVAKAAIETVAENT